MCTWAKIQKSASNDSLEPLKFGTWKGRRKELLGCNWLDRGGCSHTSSQIDIKGSNKQDVYRQNTARIVPRNMRLIDELPAKYCWVILILDACDAVCTLNNSLHIILVPANYCRVGVEVQDAVSVCPLHILVSSTIPEMLSSITINQIPILP